MLSAATMIGLAEAAVVRLAPWTLARNPVMFVVGVGVVVTAWFTAIDLRQAGDWPFDLAVTVILLFTVLFANAAEALAEARGRAQADSLRSTRDRLTARRASKGVDEEVSATQSLGGRPGAGAGGRADPLRRRDRRRGRQHQRVRSHR